MSSPLRLGGAALLAAGVLLLGFAAALLREDGDAVVTLLIVFAVVSVPALIAAVLSLSAGVRALRGGEPERGVPWYAALLALGHLGVVALSLRPGLDRELDGGDLLGGAVGSVGLVSALCALAVALPGRTLAVRVLAALAGAVLLLGLVALRAVGDLD